MEGGNAFPFGSLIPAGIEVSGARKSPVLSGRPIIGRHSKQDSL